MDHLPQRQVGVFSEVADGAVKREGAAGDGAVGEAAADAVDDDRRAHLVVRAVGQPGGGDGIGDQNQPAGLLPRHEVKQRRVDVEGVADELAVHPVVVERRADGPRLPVVQRRHGVEGVGGVGDAGLDARHGFVPGGVGVAHGDGDAHSARGADALDRAVELRSEGEEAYDVGPGAEQGRVRAMDSGFRLRALALRADEGSLRVRAQHLRAAPVGGEAVRLRPADGGEAPLKHRPVQRHGGGQPGGHAGLRGPPGHPAQLVEAAVGGVPAHEAVTVHVDQPRGHTAARGIDHLRVRRRIVRQGANLIVKQQGFARQLAVLQKQRSVDDALHGEPPSMRYGCSVRACATGDEGIAPTTARYPQGRCLHRPSDRTMMSRD